MGDEWRPAGVGCDTSPFLCPGRCLRDPQSDFGRPNSGGQFSVSTKPRTAQIRGPVRSRRIQLVLGQRGRLIRIR